MVLLLQGVLHVLLIPPPVRLGPEGPDGGALSLVQQPVLDAARVGGLRHLAPQGVQLPDQMALAGAADSRVAGHVAHRIQIDGEDDGLPAWPAPITAISNCPARNSVIRWKSFHRCAWGLSVRPISQSTDTS